MGGNKYKSGFSDQNPSSVKQECEGWKLSVQVISGEEGKCPKKKVKISIGEYEDYRGRTDFRYTKFSAGTKETPVDYVLSGEGDSTYYLSAKAEDELLWTSQITEVKLRNNDNKIATIQIKPIELSMYLDEDRNGETDTEIARCESWQWGGCEKEEHKGAIIMVKTREYEKGDTVKERMQIHFKWEGENVDSKWEATLKVDKPKMVRIFDDSIDETIPGNCEGSQIVIGPDSDAGNVYEEYEINDWAPIYSKLKDEKEGNLWIEAVDFPDKKEDTEWEVEITFEFKLEGGNPIKQIAVVRISPWIMASDLDPSDKVFAQVDLNETDGIRSFTSRAGNIEFIGTEKGKKPFTRDQIKSGFYSAPHYNLIASMTNLEEKHPIKLPIPADVGKIEKYKPKESQDNGGNYLVTPPFKGYPFGRIIYGEGKESEKCTWGKFLKAQLCQKPIVINTGWLDVGHADEILSFIPNRKNPNKYKVLIVSARLAFFMLYGAEHIRRDNIMGDDIYQILKKAVELNNSLVGNTAGIIQWKNVAEANFGRLDDTRLPDNTYENIEYNANEIPDEGHNGRFEFIYKSNAAPRLIDYFEITQAPRLSKDTPYCLIRVNTRDIINKFFVGAFGKYHYDQQVILDENEKILRSELPSNFEFLPIPLVLNAGAGGAVPTTGDSVNMLILNGPEATHCLMPKPFGPIVGGRYLFQEYIGLELGDLSLIVEFLNDPNFHIEDGEIHCGTNQMPKNDKKKWWEMPGSG